MEDTYRVAEELMAKHVLFDILVERNLRPGELEGYDLVIACGLENISDLQVQTLLGYIEKGGTLLGVGEIGARDQRGQKRMGGALGSILASSWEDGGEVETASHGEGQCIRAPSLDRLLSPAPFELFMLSEQECNDIDRIFGLIRRSEGDEGKRRRNLVKTIYNSGLDVGISNCEETLRFNAYLRPGGEPVLAIHAVNYNIPIHGMGESGPVVPAKDVSLNMPLPSGFEPDRGVIYDPPEIAGRPLELSEDNGTLTIQLQEVGIYSLAGIQLAEKLGS